MRAILNTIVVLMAVVVLASCGHDTAESNDHESSEHAAAQTSGLPGLELNNDHRWEMDDHTRASFAKMADSFLKADLQSMSAMELKQAGADLQQDIDQLIQGCTMSGGAHDQLHVFLTGYIPAVAALAESGQHADAQTVRHYLEEYDEYFE